LYALRSSPAFPPTLGFYLFLKTGQLGGAVAKPIRKTGRRIDAKRKGLKEGALPFSKENFTIIGVGLLVIVAGYVAMMAGSVEGFLPLVLAPTLLVLGYCVIVPLGIIYRKSLFKGNQTGTDRPVKPA
jgi:hypothetical protein